MPKGFFAISCDPTGKRIDTAGKRSVRMHRTAAFTEENAIAVVFRAQDSPARFSLAFDEPSGR